MKMDWVIEHEHDPLIRKHLDVIPYIIQKHVSGIESNIFLSREDLFQIGLIGLYNASETFKKTCKFRTYANTCVRNKIIDYLRVYGNKPGAEPPLSLDCEISIDYDVPGCLHESVVDRGAEDFCSQIECTDLFLRLAQQYSGITRKGICIMFLRFNGQTDRQIAKRYGLKQNNMRAWVARARKKLAQNAELIAFVKDIALYETRDTAC